MHRLTINNNRLTEELNPTNIYCFISCLGSLFVGLILLGLALWFTLLVFPAIFFLGLTWYRFLYTRNTVYLVNDEVLKVRTGLLSHTFTTLELYRVKDYVITRSLIMRIFGIMTLILYTSETNDEVVKLEGIPLSDIPDRIRNYVQYARAKSKIVEVN